MKCIHLFGFLGISGFISQKTPNFDREWSFFQFVNSQESTKWNLFIVTGFFVYS